MCFCLEETSPFFDMGEMFPSFNSMKESTLLNKICFLNQT